MSRVQTAGNTTPLYSPATPDTSKPEKKPDPAEFDLSPHPGAPSHDHSLFQQHPFDGVHTTKHGVTVPTPLRYYNANVQLLGGTVNLEEVKKLTEKYGYEPITTPDGKAIAELWVGDYADSSLGAYKEGMIAYMVKETPSQIADGSPLGLLQAMADPTAKIFCHKLLLNEQVPTDAGKEVWGFDKDMAKIDVQHEGDKTVFDYREENGEPIMSGQVSAPPSDRPEQLGGQQFIVPDVLERKANPTLCSSYTNFNPGVAPFGPNDRFSFNPKTEFGGVLDQMDFKPMVTLGDPDCQVVLATSPEQKPVEPQ